VSRESEVSELLSRELQPAKAPDFLWTRVQARLGQPLPKVRVRVNPAWAIGAVAVVTIAFGLRSQHPSGALNLLPYIETVQDAPVSMASTAIYRPPANFENISQSGQPASLAGYTVSAQRVTAIHGEPVKQLILTSGSSSVALFIASARLRLDAGANTWVAENRAGVACKRLNCPRIRTIQFPCSKETCVVICKACSEQAMQLILTELAGHASEFR
jgi:hypothetical protein